MGVCYIKLAWKLQLHAHSGTFEKYQLGFLENKNFGFGCAILTYKTFNRYRNRFSSILKNFWELLEPKNTKLDMVIIRKPNLNFKIKAFFLQ